MEPITISYIISIWSKSHLILILILKENKRSVEWVFMLTNCMCPRLGTPLVIDANWLLYLNENFVMLVAPWSIRVGAVSWCSVANSNFIGNITWPRVTGSKSLAPSQWLQTFVHWCISEPCWSYTIISLSLQGQKSYILDI